MSSFLNKLRSGVSICALVAFTHVELGAAEALRPGAFEQTQPQQPAQTQPGQLPPAQEQQTTPPTSTTVVEVTVPAPPAEPSLDLTVVEGDGGSNPVGKKSTTRPLVQVTDSTKQPIEGAVVTFIAPADGPSVMFSNGMRTITVLTDAQGRARVPSMRAINAGGFKLQVSASYHGSMVNMAIDQKNVEGKAEAAASAERPATTTPEQDKRPAANKKGISGTALALIAGGGAAAVLGIALGLGKKSSSTSTTTTTATIGGPGTVTVGAPH